jgi:hypothetical protein
MKVTVKQQPEKFKPVTLEITLESREEYEIIYDLFMYNETVSKAVYENSQRQLICAKILGNIFDELEIL